jgi:hypothetical protein
MKGHVLAAGWPFAGLLDLDAGRAKVSGGAPVQGLIVENDDESGILVLESGEAFGPLATGATTRFYGVDGYPIAREDIRVGDTVEAVQERIGAERVTSKVRVLRLAPRTSPGGR